MIIGNKYIINNIKPTGGIINAPIIEVNSEHLNESPSVAQYIYPNIPVTIVTNAYIINITVIIIYSPYPIYLLIKYEAPNTISTLPTNSILDDTPCNVSMIILHCSDVII